MYVRTGKRAGIRRLAGAHRLSGLGRLRQLGQDGGFDWSDFADTLVTTAGKVAQTAVAPAPVPTYSYKSTPYGTQIQSYSPAGASAVPSSLFSGTTGTDWTSLLLSPVGLLGMGVLAFLALKK